MEIKDKLSPGQRAPSPRQRASTGITAAKLHNLRHVRLVDEIRLGGRVIGDVVNALLKLRIGRH